jgi:hypothetical protein
MNAPSATETPLRVGDLISPFRQGAPEWINHGIPVFPMGGVDGKRPQVRRPDRIGLNASQELLRREKRPGVNLGFAPGPRSRATVIDVDSPDQRWLDRALSVYGETPLIWRTPSGGWHLAYRHNGERRRVRPIENEPIDRLAAGVCAAPPSVRGAGTYHFVSGGLDDWERLPKIRSEMSKEPGRSVPATSQAMEGTRNDKLFRSLLRVAGKVDSLDDLLDFARTLNDDYLPPLDDGEVVTVSRNAWNYQTSGNNWCGRTSRAAMEGERVKRLVAMNRDGGGDAIALCMLLKSIFSAPGITFPLATKAMEQAQTMPGWSWKRYRRAIEVLLAEGILELTKRGGNGPGNPSKYRFAGLPKW